VIQPNSNFEDLAALIRNVLRHSSSSAIVTIQHTTRGAADDTVIERAVLPREALRVIGRVLRIHGSSEHRPESYVQAPDVARLLGIKTGTLAKWRRLGRGPKGWTRTSATSVSYPASEVDAFLRAWKETSNPGCR
jgi:DNA-binding transcriptional regulator YiaG